MLAVFQPAQSVRVFSGAEALGLIWVISPPPQVQNKLNFLHSVIDRAVSADAPPSIAQSNVVMSQQPMESTRTATMAELGWSRRTAAASATADLATYLTAA
jgi:hypothetical protein